MTLSGITNQEVRVNETVTAGFAPIMTSILNSNVHVGFMLLEERERFVKNIVRDTEKEVKLGRSSIIVKAIDLAAGWAMRHDWIIEWNVPVHRY